MDFHVRDLPDPGPNEVVVDIHAAALNFRDILISINMLPELSYEGMAASGVIRRVGSNVTHLKAGDRVATAEAMCFANRLMAPASRVTKLHDNMTLEVAAAVQSVYNTAYHALINVARICKGG